MASMRYALLFFAIGFMLNKRITESQSQGRIIFAPPSYVQHNMFDVDFWSSILQDSSKNSFFYPAHILPQLQPDAKEHNDAKYAKEMADKHAGMGSDVAIDATSVVRLDASEGSLCKGQKITHEFVFSARTVPGANGTQTIFEYTKAWHRPILIHNLHKRNLLPRSWFEITPVEDIDSEGIDLFRVEVEKAWERLS